MDKKIPNPGSNEAIKLKCSCPVMDNGHGKGYMGQQGIFYINETCPLHGTKSKEAQNARR